MELAKWLLTIGVGMVAVGIILAVVGIVLDPGPQRRGAEAEEKKSFTDKLLELARSAHKVIIDPNARRFMKLAALGLLLIYLGLAFLVASAIPAIIDALTDDSSGGGTGEPSPSPSPSDTPPGKS